jgi:hypothetical protein
MTPRQAIAHYAITSKLGEGGMGTVYRAIDTKLHREVAIKVLPDAFAADPDRLARFTREAQVLASLNHPNIASIYGVEDRALVMELVEGETVSEAIAQVLAKEPDWTQAPAPVRRLLRSCLQKDPKARLKSIGDWRLLLDEGGTAASAPVRANRLPWAVAVAAMLFGAAAAGWGWLRHEAPITPGAYELDVLPPNGETVHQDAGGGYQAISPDGRTLAYISEGNGARHILVRPLDSPTSRVLAGTELADGLFWSPDSRHVGFTAGSKLERVDLATGTVREICDSGGTSLRGATWNADGTIMFGSIGTPLQKVPGEGGRPVPVLAYGKGEVVQLFPQFLPDGKHFLFWVRGGQVGLGGVYAGSIDRPPDQERRQILAGPTAATYAASTGSKGGGYLLFLRERTLLPSRSMPSV